MTQFKHNNREPNSVAVEAVWFEWRRKSFHNDITFNDWLLNNIPKLRFSESWAVEIATKMNGEGISPEIVKDGAGFWLAFSTADTTEAINGESSFPPTPEIVTSLQEQGYGVSHGTNGYIVFKNKAGDQKIFGSYQEKVEKNIEN